MEGVKSDGPNVVPIIQHVGPTKELTIDVSELKEDLESPSIDHPTGGRDFLIVFKVNLGPHEAHSQARFPRVETPGRRVNRQMYGECIQDPDDEMLEKVAAACSLAKNLISGNEQIGLFTR
ncbi:hypothetical protein CISG_00898 [Coccidioides immitis RMSCC 3703]|uniref:Uncharacterized protein n=1 Tax=Coccidioides immitis RMSCC 3703 TaxID=454286 RepID=A0A0J8QQS3_COCIT|nr:hypothetical protein CISG_00898 [Coccidioides immitis RMSCC 3703]